jgi:putative transposase
LTKETQLVTCRDEADLQRCVDDIHVNPLEHGLVSRVIDWPWSSFHRYVQDGYHYIEWGNSANWYGDEFRNAE